MKISLRINPQKENKNKKSLIPERGKGFFFLIKDVVSIIVVLIIRPRGIGGLLDEARK